MTNDRKIPFSLIRSRRKTLSLEIKNGTLIARAPMRMPRERIEEFIESRMDWIEKYIAKSAERRETAAKEGYLTAEEINVLAEKALAYIPKRVEYYAEKIGAGYGKITIRNQRSKWGSCSSKGNLSFNCLLMLTPPEVIDAIVVHELCHRKEMNHSAKFYSHVYAAYPDYDRWNKWLTDNGSVIMERMTGGK